MQYRVVNTQQKDWISLVRIVGRNSLKLRDIDTAELEKQIVDIKNNYQVKQLLKIQLQKRPPIE